MTALPASFLLLFIFFTIGSATTRKITKSPAFESVRSKQEENWRRRAIDILWAERRRWGHTPIVRIPLAGFPNVDILFKNESTTPTGSLKHRFAWSLMLWGVLEGHVSKGIEKEKAAHLEEYGAKLVRVDADQRRPVSKRLGAKPNHWLVDQHANSEKAIDSFENGNFSFESANLFHELYKQLHFKAPDYVIHGLGTGGTITSIGRYVHRYNLPTRVVGADSEFSLLYDYVKSGAFTSEKEGGHSQWKGPGVAGIGFGYQHEAIHFGTSSSLLRSVIDEVVKLPDIVSTAGSRVLTGLKTNTGRTLSGGPSTALNFLVALAYAHRHNGTPARHTTIASLICDQIVHYRSTVLDDKWVAKSFKDGLPRVHCWENAIKTVIAKGGDFVKLGKNC